MATDDHSTSNAANLSWPAAFFDFVGNFQREFSFEFIPFLWRVGSDVSVILNYIVYYGSSVSYISALEPFFAVSSISKAAFSI